MSFTPDILIRTEDGTLYYIPVYGLREKFSVEDPTQYDFSLVNQLLDLTVDVAFIPDPKVQAPQQQGTYSQQNDTYLLNLFALKTKDSVRKAYKLEQNYALEKELAAKRASQESP